MNKLQLASSLLFITVAATARAETIPGIGPEQPVEKIAGGFEFTEGPVWGPPEGDDSPGGVLYFTDIPNEDVVRLPLDKQGKPTAEPVAVIDDSRHANGLAWSPEGKLLACEMDGQLVAWDLKTEERIVLAAEYGGARFNACNDLVVDADGGVYFTDPKYRAPNPMPQPGQGVYYVNADGQVTRLLDALPAPNGVALAPDGKTLYVIPSGDSTIRAYEVLSPGKIGPERPHGKMWPLNVGGGDGGAVDEAGNLYATTMRGVLVFNPAGEQLGNIELPESPANCTFGGLDGKTLFVTARTSVYAVRLQIAGAASQYEK